MDEMLNEVLNDFYLDCTNLNLNDHRLMYNQMLNVMDEMLQEVFDDLVLADDQNLILGPYNTYNVPPNDGQHTFNWNDAIHHLNLLGLHKAKEYIEDAVGYPNQNPPIPPNDPALSFLVGQYNLWINGNEENNFSPLFNVNTCN